MRALRRRVEAIVPGGGVSLEDCPCACCVANAPEVEVLKEQRAVGHALLDEWLTVDAAASATPRCLLDRVHAHLAGQPAPLRFDDTVALLKRVAEAHGWRLASWGLQALAASEPKICPNTGKPCRCGVAPASEGGGHYDCPGPPGGTGATGPAAPLSDDLGAALVEVCEAERLRCDCVLCDEPPVDDE